MERLKNLSLHIERVSGDLFSHVTLAPPDPILNTAVAFSKDTDKDKVNLGIGAYRDQNGKPYVFNVVRDVEKKILTSNLNKEYSPIEGSVSFNTGARNLILGQNCQAVKQNRVVSIQALSGTGAISIGCEFLKAYLPRFIYIPNPTWLNHKGIIDDCGLKYIQYPYYNAKTKGSNIPAMLKFLQNGIAGSIVLLHACAHNPTGVDPTQSEWIQIAKVMKKNNLTPFFDSAYQGFASGDLQKDAFPVRHFVNQGFQIIIAQSFAKNMGLYGERIGALHFITNNKNTAQNVSSQLKVIIRRKYSSPPIHGALIASTILNDKKYFQAWARQLKDDVAARILKMRKVLREQLQAIKAPGTWNHITDQIGMFSYTGLTTKQCEILINKFHIYLLKSGRISMAGINEKNVRYLAKSIKAAIAQSQ